MGDLARLVAACYGRTLELVTGPPAVGGTPRRCPKVDKLAALGYRPRVPLAEGVSRFVRWCEENPTLLPAGAPALAPGPIVTPSGETIGAHEGFARYSIGQRRGLPGGRSRPLHVVAIRPLTREVVVGDAEELDGWSVELNEVNWLVDPLEPGEACEVQVRNHSRAVSAEVTSCGGPRLALRLLEPARAVAPGQSGVLYRGDLVLGGGVIG